MGICKSGDYIAEDHIHTTTNHNGSITSERSVIYLGGGGGVNMFYWVQILALYFCSATSINYTEIGLQKTTTVGYRQSEYYTSRIKCHSGHTTFVQRLPDSGAISHQRWVHVIQNSNAYLNNYLLYLLQKFNRSYILL